MADNVINTEASTVINKPIAEHKPATSVPLLQVLVPPPDNKPQTAVNESLKILQNSIDAPSSSSSLPSSTPAGQSLVDFLRQVDNYQTTIPENVVKHYLESAGVETNQPEVIYLISLASQKFIADIANDAMQYSKTLNPGTDKKKQKKNTLTMDILKPVLEEYGIHVKKPPYVP